MFKISLLKICALLFFFIGPSAFAQEATEGPDLDGIILANQHEIHLGDGALTGPGADWLAREAEAAHFFMFGEQHATADIANLTIATYALLGNLGYDHAAIEVGRWETDFIETLIREKGMAGYAEFMAEDLNLLSVPFFFFQEEAPLLEMAMERSDYPSLWGLDQEFIGSSVVLLERLMGLATSEQEKGAVAGLLEQARQVPFILGVMPNEALMALKGAFAASESTEANTLIDEIILTNRIYGPFTGKGGSIYLANLERENFMKTNFVRYYENAQNQSNNHPKVFMKFGGNHAFRGFSPTDVPALGNFVADFAQARGLSAFNMAVECLGGMARDALSGNEVPCGAYFLTPDSPFKRLASTEELTLFNLKALRSEKALLKSLDEKTRQLVFAFDALLIAPNTAAATFFPGTRAEFN